MNNRFDLTENVTGQSYADLLEEIKNNLNPDNNAVLLVDDEKGIRRRVARDVKSFDKSIIVYEAGNGKEALEKLEAIRRMHHRDPLFIVLDLNMPIMDGWEFIKELRDDYTSKGKSSGVPIIVLSSTSGEKGLFINKMSVHNGKSGYTPLVAIAKEACTKKDKYDAEGEKGLIAWLRHFMKSGHI